MNFCDTCGQSMGVRSTVRVCAVCETTERLEAEHAEAIARLTEQRDMALAVQTAAAAYLAALDAKDALMDAVSYELMAPQNVAQRQQARGGVRATRQGVDLPREQEGGHGGDFRPMAVVCRHVPGAADRPAVRVEARDAHHHAAQRAAPGVEQQRERVEPWGQSLRLCQPTPPACAGQPGEPEGRR